VDINEEWVNIYEFQKTLWRFRVKMHWNK
jgi:hypothetical protein